MNSSDDPPRLIEVAFPLRQASVASVHEKNVRHGHISTLHIWPARRPLAACRAALLATLLPDPGDSTRRAELLREIGGDVVVKHVTETGSDGREVSEEKKTVVGGVLAWGNESGEAMDRFRAALRAEFPGGPPRVLDPFAGGGAIPLEAMRLGCQVTAGDLNPVAWFILKCTLDYPQRFADKRWPLPAFTRQWPDFLADFRTGKIKRRKGADRPHFTDGQQLSFKPTRRGVKPAAQSSVAEAVEEEDFDDARHDATLAWHVRAWGRWVLERARTELAARYPEHNGETTVAYLHARTARDKFSGARIPLLKTFWLCKQAGRRSALLPVPLVDKSGVKFCLLGERELANPARVMDEYPHLVGWEVTAASFSAFLARGTMNRSGVWCPASGRPGMVALTMDDLRRQGQQGLLGTQMTAVIAEQTVGKNTRKRYRLPTIEDLQAADVDEEDLEEVFREVPYGIPDEPTPAGEGSGAARAFSLHKYGMKKWRDIFTPRQLLSLGVFVKHTRAAINELKKLYPNQPEIAEGVGVGLTILFGKFVDYFSTLCLWSGANDEVLHTFSRFALPITWDFAEANPFTHSARFYAGGIDVASKTIEHFCKAFSAGAKSPVVLRESSLASKMPQDLILTDPPYYDAIPYSDLMDYFYIWQRRIWADQNSEFANAFAAPLAPKWDEEAKDGELIEDETRHGGDRAKAKQAYEDGMAASFQKCHLALSQKGRLVVVFANKEVDAWETLVAAIIRAGFVVTASWPIQTERTGRLRSNSSAALSSSVWIVCRKRQTNASAGWDKAVLDQMHQILFSPRESLGHRNILQYYFDLGIRGPDFLWAALGPSLEAFSGHPFVRKQGGGTMGITEFLRQVRRLVLQFSLGELPGFHDISRDIAGRGESLDLDPITQYYLLHRAFFGLKEAPAGACILYANGCGINESALKLVWNILEQGGKAKKTRGAMAVSSRIMETMADDESDDAGAAIVGKGNEYRLVDWRARGRRDGAGEVRAGQAAPLIDRLHRLMFLLSVNRAAEVQEAYENWGLSAEAAFLPLMQALHSLADRDGRAEEKKLVEALASQLKLGRRAVINREGAVQEDALAFPGWLKQNVEF